MMQPAALLFDMDGLLLDTERLLLTIAVDDLAKVGVDPAAAEALFVSCVGSSNAHTKAQLAEVLPDGLSADAFFTDWFAKADAQMAQSVPLRPYVRESLSSLADDRRRMAVVTSTSGDRARAHLTHAGLLDYFEFVVGGDEVTANKPDPAPYLTAAARMGVDPQDCHAFEDSDRGITSAVRAGCVSTQIPDLRAPDVPLPDLGQRVAEDLRQALTASGLL